MQFRTVGDRVQVSVYDGYDREKRRSIVRVVGSMDRLFHNEFNDKLKEYVAANPEAKKEIDAWIAEQRAARVAQRHARLVDATISHIAGGTSSIGEISQLIKAGTIEITPAQIDKFAAEFERLKAALKSIGVPLRRPSGGPVAPPVPEGQGALSLD